MSYRNYSWDLASAAARRTDRGGKPGVLTWTAPASAWPGSLPGETEITISLKPAPLAWTGWASDGISKTRDLSPAEIAEMRHVLRLTRDEKDPAPAGDDSDAETRDLQA